MSQQNIYLQFQSNSHYPGLEEPEKVFSQKKSKKTQSNMSTRKSSADSMDLRVKFKTEVHHWSF